LALALLCCFLALAFLPLYILTPLFLVFPALLEFERGAQRGIPIDALSGFTKLGGKIARPAVFDVTALGPVISHP
jgi:hypothetical protein